MSPTRILVVEDEAIVAESLRSKLESFGHEVVAIAASGKDAVRQATRHQPDLVLMDIMLQGDMDGIEASAKIHERFSIPVVFLTAYSDDSTLERAKITEPYGYIIKPFKDRELKINISITLYKHAIEAKLAEREQRISAVLASVADGIITLNIDGKIDSISSVAEALLSTSSDQWIGRSYNDLPFEVTKGDAATPFSMVKRAIAGETVACLIGEEVWLSVAEGNRIPIDLGVSPLVDSSDSTGATMAASTASVADGNPDGNLDSPNKPIKHGVVIAIRDLSDRKDAEQVLVEAQKLVANLLTQREREILQLMVNGDTTKEIAFNLEISARTVEAHRHNMMRKLDVHDITALVRCAITQKLVVVE